MFTGIACRYDFLNRLLSLGQDKRWRREAVQSIPCKDGGIHLDLACGTADVGIELAGLVEKAFLVGVDISLAMLEIGREKVKSRGIDDFTFVSSAGESLPFKDGVFDSVSIAFGIRNMVVREMALKEIARVLKKGGVLVILEFSVPENNFTRKAYLFYFRKLLPFLGGLFSDRKAYAYLPESVLDFPSRGNFLQMLLDSGLKNVESRSLSWGIVTLYKAVSI